MSDIVLKLWGFCHTLRHDGIDYGDYIEQLTYLLFLKMADERDITLPRGCDWPTLVNQSGTDLTNHYIEVLRTLGQARGLLGDIFAGAMSRFHNPVNLKKLIGLIDETEWTLLGVDVKAEAFEGLLEKAASEGKKGAVLTCAFLAFAGRLLKETLEGFSFDVYAELGPLRLVDQANELLEIDRVGEARLGAGKDVAEN